MDDRLKRLLEELGVAINDTISGSEQIADVIAQMEGSGYRILLFLKSMHITVSR